MVKSILDPSINYPEIRKLNDEDKDYHDAIVWWLEDYPEKSWRVQ